MYPQMLDHVIAPGLLRQRLTRRTFLILVLFAAIVLSAGPVGVGRAATTIVVNSTLDRVSADGACTLREAIIAANRDTSSGGGPGECPAGSGADTILLPAGAYILSRTDNGREDAAVTGDLDIRGSVTISTTGAVTITAIAGFSDRIFQIHSGSVTLFGLTVSGGRVAGGGGGATVGNGGGIYNSATLTIVNSTLSGNSASMRGGAVYNASSGVLALTNGTISGNTAGDHGGGLFNAGASTLAHVTISNNTADGNGDGSGNGGGVYANSGAVVLGSTIIAGNHDLSVTTKHPDCSGTLVSQGYNLVQSVAGCTITGTTTGNLTGVSANLGPLQNNGGATFTHALLPGSPAIDAIPAANCAVAADQRDYGRPFSEGGAPRCDMGAVEAGSEPRQPGPIFTVTSTADRDDGICGVSHCTLREAINAANARPNDDAPDEIRFGMSGSGPHVIQPASALPAIGDGVILNGTTQSGARVELDGANAGAGVDGLTITSDGSAVRGLTIHHFDGDGVRMLSGSGNRLDANSIYANGGLGIDLGPDGVTPNDTGDPDAGANGLLNFPVLTRVVRGASATTIQGRINSAANMTFTLQFFADTACDPSGFGEGQTFLGATSVTADDSGNAYFRASLSITLPEGQPVTATATDAAGNTSEFSQCVPAGPGNDSWPDALELEFTDGVALTEEFIDKQGQSRWYKFDVQPNSRVIITLRDLPENYDLSVYKDISATHQALASRSALGAGDLALLSAEFAPDAFSPDAFSPDAFSPDAFSPDAFSPDAFSPDAFSPDAFSPDAFSPDAFSPDAFSPDAFSPDAFSPDAFSPDAFSPDAFSPDAFSPDAFSPDAFSSAQSRSLIGVSAFEGTVSEGIIVNTWDNDGEFYVRVRGRNGAFSLDAPFHLQVTLAPGSCNAVVSELPPASLTAAAGNYKTVVLIDLGRMAGSAAEKSALQARLAAFAARPEVAGVIVDVSLDARVAAANAQADAYPTCPFARNLVADAIKDIVDRYWALNPLEYVVILGNDDAIPFFRYPDNALLATEKNYVPPVRDATSSQASLKLGFVLSQDRYGARLDVSLKNSALPIPDLAVGRLVETATDVTGMLDAYLSTSGGVAPAPASALVTGYDFLEDAARAVQAELEAGIGAPAGALIAERNLSPQHAAAWTADDLGSALLGSRHDLIFLAGHFSANSALAADYTTRLLSSEVVSSSVNLTNAIIFSAGCHSGYNIVDPHGVPGVTREPDWAQAFARKGATLVAGTGYQYGDTDFIEYSERLYLEFSRQLRTGSGPVAVGKALVAAKQVYLADTAQMRGIHEKAFLEATLFGLPMLSVDMPGARLTPGAPPSIVAAVTPFTSDPGLTLGLGYADVTVTPTLTLHQTPLDVVSSNAVVTATYLSGANGVIANPAEPTLPVELYNVSVADLVLRGVGFRGGAYTDLENVLPLLGAATTEVRGVHTPFLSNIFYPVQTWTVNYFDALANGATRLVLLPAQFKSSAPTASTGILRRLDSVNLRLYYSDNVASYGNGSTPALAAPPAITRVSGVPDGGSVSFQVNVVGNPAAGIQEVWVTYTATDGPYAGAWQSLDLVQNASDSALWEGTLPLNGAFSENLRYAVQAVNGVGLVSLATNLGAYYVPRSEVTPSQPSALALEIAAPAGAYGTQATFSAMLTSNGAPLEGQVVAFDLGAQRRLGTTDSDGRAEVSIPLIGLPGEYEIHAVFAGTAQVAPSSATGVFTITKQSSGISLPPQAIGRPGARAVITATLAAANRSLGEKTVIFVVTGSGGSASIPVITDYAGRAPLGNIPLPTGAYSVTAYFSGSPLPGITLDDDRYDPSQATAALTLNNPPDCSTAFPSVLTIWPPNGSFVAESVLGVIDPDGDPITITIMGIRQDEPVGGSPDGVIVGPNQARVRAERDGNGNGRVYHIFFTATDSYGQSCSGQVRVGIVPHDQGGNIPLIDEGPIYDSTQ